MTHATVKDHIVSYIQRTYRYGKDIAVPEVQSSKTGDDRKIEQDGFDIIYQAEVKQFLERERESS